jgi:hypothetical protein
MLSEALQRNPKDEGQAFKHLWIFQFMKRSRIWSEMESLASRTSSAALQLRVAQNDIRDFRA